MKNKVKALKSAEYILLHGSFKEWLQLLNYSAGSVQVLPLHVSEFLRYLEAGNKTTLQQLTASDATDFIRHLKGGTGERTRRPYSGGHINKYMPLHQGNQKK
jgi:integrase/recombinase XerD